MKRTTNEKKKNLLPEINTCVSKPFWTTRLLNKTSAIYCRCPCWVNGSSFRYCANEREINKHPSLVHYARRISEASRVRFVKTAFVIFDSQRISICQRRLVLGAQSLLLTTVIERWLSIFCSMLWFVLLFLHSVLFISLPCLSSSFYWHPSSKQRRGLSGKKCVKITLQSWNQNISKQRLANIIRLLPLIS